MNKYVFYRDLDSPRNKIPKRYKVVYWKMSNGAGFGYTSLARPAFDAVADEAVNKALDKLYEKFGQAEDLRVAWKERQTAIDMVTSGVRTIVNIARAVKRRDPRIIRAILRRNPTWKDVATTPSGLWLQYWFGIVPTISDIHHAAGIFTQDFPEPELRVRASAAWEDSVSGYPELLLPGASAWVGGGSYVGRVEMGGKITAIDPNVSLASSLGFGQPLSVAWEMTPFSWFVDYFVNVGSLITNLEPRFPGFTVVDKYTSIKTTAKVSGYFRAHNGWGWYPDSSHYIGNLVGFRRSTDWPNYQLVFNSPLDLKWKQCSYIVAVAVQLLSSFKR